MELIAGPSDQWEYTEEMRKREELVTSWYSGIEHTGAIGVENKLMLEVMLVAQWIEWAYKNGDETWRDYAEFGPYPPLVTYHESKHKARDFTIYNSKSRIWEGAEDEWAGDNNRKRWSHGVSMGLGSEEGKGSGEGQAPSASEGGSKVLDMEGLIREVETLQ